MTLSVPRPGSPDGAFAGGAGGALKLGRTCSLSSTTGQMRASWESFLQSTVALRCLPQCPLKARMAPGLVLSFGCEEECRMPLPAVPEEVVVPAKHPASIWKTTNMDGGLTE